MKHWEKIWRKQIRQIHISTCPLPQSNHMVAWKWKWRAVFFFFIENANYIPQCLIHPVFDAITSFWLKILCSSYQMIFDNNFWILIHALIDNWKLHFIIFAPYCILHIAHIAYFTQNAYRIYSIFYQNTYRIYSIFYQNTYCIFLPKCISHI